MVRWLEYLVVLVTLAVAAGCLVVVARMHSEANLAFTLSVGMDEATALRTAQSACGDPVGTLSTESDFDRAAFTAYQRPRRMLGTRATVFLMNRKLIYIFANNDGIVTCVFWAEHDEGVDNH